MRHRTLFFTDLFVYAMSKEKEYEHNEQEDY